ncbi:MAG: citrate lyase subunit alpha, partial [Myxococcota bacterium]
MSALVENAAGRLVPREINGKEAVPYQGVGGYRPAGRKVGPPLRSSADYPADGNKVVGSLREALEKCGVKSGATIGTHHHFRNGDMVANGVFDALAAMGHRDLVWAPSASFPCHAPMIRYLESGVMHHIEGSMNGP